MVRQEAWRREAAVARAEDHVTPAWHDVARLEAVVGQLSTRDAEFAASLLSQHKQRGSLTQKQLFWVRELVKRVAQRGAAQPSPSAIARPPMVRAIAFSKLAELFLRGAHAKTFVVFTTASGSVRLALTGPQSAYPGQINVTSEGRQYADRVWFGRISEDGGWVASRKVSPEDLRAVELVLMEAETDPVAALTKAGAAWGQQTGVCCFCSLRLTDPRSVSVGYGPICADHFGLPWGSVPGKLTCAEVKEEQRQVISDAEIPF